MPRSPTVAQHPSPRAAPPPPHLRVVRGRKTEARVPGARAGGRHGGGDASKKDAELAQMLGQLQPFIAVFPQECIGQLAAFGPT